MYNFMPVSGSPLIPIKFIIFYLAILFVLTFTLTLLFSRYKQITKWSQWLKIFALETVAVNLLLILAIAFITIYTLVPSPSIITSTPLNQALYANVKNPIEITFSRPVSRKNLSKSINPEIPGVWVFENPVYDTHLYRKLVFYPQLTLHPDTEYIVTLSNIKNFLQLSPPIRHAFSFQTQPSPRITEIELAETYATDSHSPIIKIHLDRPIDNSSYFDFEISPSLEFDTYINPTDDIITLFPTIPFQSGIEYHLQVTKSDLIWDLSRHTVFERKPAQLVYRKTIGSSRVLGIQSFQPSEGNVFINTPIKIVFSDAMDKQSVQQNISIVPAVSGTFVWFGDKALQFDPVNWKYDTKYTFKVLQTAKKADGSELGEDIIRQFSTLGRVKIESSHPQSGWAGVATDHTFSIRFDQQVDHSIAESKFSITPSVNGTFTWQENTMIFKPSHDLSYSTDYTFRLSKGVKSLFGLDLENDFFATFTTQESVNKLDVPVLLQQHTLSCEAASLRMVLSYRGVDISENKLLSDIGRDPTPHDGSIWGNPYVNFVGNVNGRQMVNGYGVYWEPIARVANKYRYSTSFEGWSLKQLTETLSKGHPLIVWGYVRNGRSTSWNTPGGDKIEAVADEHTVVAIGYVGTASNPSYIIVNDPLSGEVYWSKDAFEKKWNVFGRSGVIVY